MPNPYTETAAELAARVKADPELWNRLSHDQRIAVGFQQRADDQKHTNQQKGN